MSLSFSWEAIIPYIHFGFNISLALSFDWHLYTACGHMQRSSHIHRHLSTLLLSSWMGGLGRCIQGQKGKWVPLFNSWKFFLREGVKVCHYYAQWKSSPCLDKTGGLSQVVSEPYITRIKGLLWVLPWRIRFHLVQSMHCLIGCVPPERLKNGRLQSRSKELLPSSCTVKLILIKIDYSIWDTWVINF